MGNFQLNNIIQKKDDAVMEYHCLLLIAFTDYGYFSTSDQDERILKTTF